MKNTKTTAYHTSRLAADNKREQIEIHTKDKYKLIIDKDSKKGKAIAEDTKINRVSCDIQNDIKDVINANSTKKERSLLSNKKKSGREKSLSQDKVHTDFKQLKKTDIFDFDRELGDGIGSSRTKEKSKKMRALSKPRAKLASKYEESNNDKYKCYENLVNQYKNDKGYDKKNTTLKVKDKDDSLNLSGKKTSRNDNKHKTNTLKEKVLEDFVLFEVKSKQKNNTSRNHKLAKTFSNKKTTNKPIKALKHSLHDNLVLDKPKRPLTMRSQYETIKSKKTMSTPFVNYTSKTIVSKPLTRLCGRNVTFVYYSGISSQSIHI